MSEMVERVALALRRYDVSGTVSRVLARAAIEAMRGPTKAMMYAANEECQECAGLCWDPMIDAALIDVPVYAPKAFNPRPKKGSGK